ncbi:MAG: hypothetical protein ACRCT8_15030 [Lacipirellulaceae bacterium]
MKSGRVVRHAALCVGALIGVADASAASVSFNAFTAETYQPVLEQQPAAWLRTDLVLGSGDGLIAGEVNNSYPTIYHHGANAVGSKIKYLWRPGSDDDLSGFVLGFDPNETVRPRGLATASASYLLFDWKRVTEAIDYFDPPDDPQAPTPRINDATAGTTAVAGMQASWVHGIPSSDELWGKADLPGFSIGGVDVGGVTPIASGAGVASDGYTPNQSYVVEIEYSAEQLRVTLDGAEAFNLTPADVPGANWTQFPAGRFGLYEAFQSPGSVFSQVDIRPLGSDSAPNPAPLPTPTPFALTPGVKAFTLNVTNEDAPTSAAAWTVARSTQGDDRAFSTQAPNNGDVDIAFGASLNPNDPAVRLGLRATEAYAPGPADGIMLASVAQNGARARNVTTAAPIYATVEAPWDSGFGGVVYGLAIGETLDGSESTATVAGAFFPYSDNWVGALVNGNGTLRSSFGGIAVTQLTPPAVATPTPASQNGLYSVTVPNASSATDGFVIAVGGSNNNNVVGASPMADGTWRVAVRDNSNANSGPNRFEAANFNFVFFDTELTEGLVGAYVAGFNETGAALLGPAAGDFSLTRQAVGQWFLEIPGVAPFDGVLMLTAASTNTLGNGLVAPANHYLTYAPSGGGFLIELRQLNGTAAPTLVDGAFSFAYIGYDSRLTVVPEPATLYLAAATILGVARRRGR